MRNFVLNTWYGIKELHYWFKLRKVIKRNKNTPKWKKHKLRIGWINQIYTVVNLKDEYMGEEEQVQRMRVMELVMPINEYVASMGDFVKDVVRIELVHEPETKSWVVIYWPLFNYFGFWWFVKRVLYIYLGWITVKLSIIYLIPLLIKLHQKLNLLW